MHDHGVSPNSIMFSIQCVKSSEIASKKIQWKEQILGIRIITRCARKMCHLLLAGYEDVPSFLNQWKLKRGLILFFEDIFYKAGGALN